MHIDGQQAGMVAIVAVAAVSVGRRIAGQVASFRGGGRGSGCGGCDGCRQAARAGTEAEEPLLQIRMSPPARTRGSRN
ncbi:MAG: hypothetical protein ACLQVD_08680 [Capsulimonadaceae bacterium]